MQHTLLTPQQLAHLIQSARRTAGLSQAELALRIGVSQSRMSKLERDPGGIAFSQLLKLASTLGLELTLRERNQGASPSAPGEW